MQKLLIPRQFAHQKMLHWDPPSTSRHEISTSGDAGIRFGRFCVLLRARQLLDDGQPVELGSRAFDLLMVLIRSAGTVVTKNEIVSQVWPDTVVAEENLKVQVSALRKVLNEDRDVIKTVHGRGYVFTAEVTSASVESDAFASPGPEPTRPPPGRALPTNSSASSSPRRQWATGSQMIAPDDKAQPVVVVIDDDPDIREAPRASANRRTARRVIRLGPRIPRWCSSGPSRVPGSRCQAARAKRARFSRGAGQGKFAPADHVHQRSRRCPDVGSGHEGRCGRVPDQTCSRSRSAGRNPAGHRAGPRPPRRRTSCCQACAPGLAR